MNCTNISTDGYGDDFPQFSLPTKVIFTSAMLFTSLVSVIGNSLVIYVITKHHSMRTSTNCLMMNLAICDLLITVIQNPTFIKGINIGGKWFGGIMGSVTCKITVYGLYVLLFCSFFNLVAIAIDRFLAVTRPLTYKLSSKWLVKIGIPAMWLISSLFTIQAPLSSQVNFDEGDLGPKCEYKRSSFGLYSSATCLVASFITLIVLYSIICYRLWRRNIPGVVSSNQHALAIRTARKVTVLMISIVIVFFVSWAPIFAVILFQLANDGSIVIAIAVQYPFLFPISYWLVSTNNAFNPCLYFIFIESFRQGLKTACSRCRVPRLRLRRIGQGRSFETGEPMRNRRNLNSFNQEERNIELTAYSMPNK